jgi:hypothetical protein
VNTATIDAALRPISDALERDGCTVGLELADGGVSLGLTAGPEACVDCLVLKPMMEQLFVQALGDAGLDLPGDRVR